MQLREATVPAGSRDVGGHYAWVLVGRRPARDIAMQKPNGTNLLSTNFNLRVKGIAPSQTLVFTISGTLGAQAGTAMFKVVEKRPGAPFCPSQNE